MQNESRRTLHDGTMVDLKRKGLERSCLEHCAKDTTTLKHIHLILFYIAKQWKSSAVEWKILCVNSAKNIRVEQQKSEERGKC